MGLVITHDVVAESIDVCDLCHLLPVVLDHMADDVLDVFPLDEIEEFQASGVQKIVTRHRLNDQIQNGLKKLALGHLLNVELVLQLDEIAEEL